MLKCAGVTNEWVDTQLYRNSEEQHHAGLPETKFGHKNVRNKVCSVTSRNDNFKAVFTLTRTVLSIYDLNFQAHCLVIESETFDRVGETISDIPLSLVPTIT